MRLTIFSLCLFTSTVFGINYHGKYFTTESFHSVENFGNEILKENPNATIKSVLSTDNMNSAEAISFLKDANILNMTFTEFMDSTVPSTTISRRAPIRYQCRNDAVVLSDTIRKQICYGLSSVAGGGVGLVAYYVDGLACNQQKEAPTACHAFYTFSAITGGTLATNEVNEFCPSLLAKITSECDNKGGRGQDVGTGYQLTVRYEEGSQGDCRDVTDNCKAENNT